MVAIKMSSVHAANPSRTITGTVMTAVARSRGPSASPTVRTYRAHSESQRCNEVLRETHYPEQGCIGQHPLDTGCGPPANADNALVRAAVIRRQRYHCAS